MSKDEFDKAKRNLYNTARSCISYVGYANYAHREKAANKALDQSYRTGEYVDPDKVD